MLYSVPFMPCITDVGVVINAEGAGHLPFIRELDDSHAGHIIYGMASHSAYENSTPTTVPVMLGGYIFHPSYVMKRRLCLQVATVMADPDENRLLEVPPSGEPRIQ